MVLLSVDFKFVYEKKTKRVSNNNKSLKIYSRKLYCCYIRDVLKHNNNIYYY